MLSKLSNLFKSVPLTLEEWAEKNSKKCSAEEIIAAAIIQSFATAYDKWQDNDFDNPESAFNTGTGRLTLAKKEITIQRYAERKYNNTDYDYRFNGMTVNDVTMPKYLEKAIISSWLKIAVRLREAEAVANRVKTEMDDTNKAWDMAEKLLGMKRNEHGALVPKETVK